MDLELPRFEMKFATEPRGTCFAELGLQTAFDVASADFRGNYAAPGRSRTLRGDPPGLVKGGRARNRGGGGDGPLDGTSERALKEDTATRPYPSSWTGLSNFFIQERLTGAVLFMGRVLDPAA